MSQGVIKIFRASKPHHWQDSVQWFAITLIGSFFPMWATFIVLNLVSKTVDITKFVENGEFALYTASFVVPSLYHLSKEKSLAFQERPTITAFGYFLLAIAALVFGCVTVLSSGAVDTIALLNKPFLLHLSAFILVLASVFIFVTHHLDSLATDPDIRGILTQTQVKLEAQFEALGVKDE